MRIANYQIEETIHESSRTRVHRGRRADGLEVIIKGPGVGASVADFAAHLRHELLMCQMFDSPSLVKVVELVEGSEGPALVFESVPGAVTLVERAQARKLGVRESITIALGIVDALARVHGQGVVHKDIKPENVLVNADLSRVVLLDFGIATIVARDLSVVQVNTRLEGTLSFMPPEQTGRVNRAIDYRSDYYALGSTLHWMLVGEPPFAGASEPRQLVHAHIAKAAPLVHELDPSIPAVLGRVVAKLLSKSAEDRYQGSFGLRADLRRCLDGLDGLDGPDDFELASLDPPEHLHLEHHLYGREPALEALRGQFERIERGPLLLPLSGPPGSGKTTLAQEFHRSLDHEVLCVSGEFDPDGRSEPYAAVSAPLRMILARLMEHGESCELLRARVREAVGPNASLLLTLFPEVEQLLGGTATVEAVGPGQARDRFRDTLERFTDALLMPGHDYVLFIDDLQWADEPSLRVIESLCAGGRRRLMVVVALRDDAEAQGSAARELLTRLQGRGLCQAPVELGPLSAEDVGALVGDALQGAPGCSELASLLHRRTQGTPLFVGQLLNALHAKGIVDIERSTGRWCVDLQRAREHESTGDVVEFLVSRFAELSEPTRRVLGVAACIGLSFDFETLSAVAVEPQPSAIWLQPSANEPLPSAIWGAVLEAAGAGYVLSTGSGWGSGTHADGTSSAGGPPVYRFAHSRFRQVALSAVPDPRAPLHLAIARALQARFAGGQHNNLQAKHIGHAIELLTASDRSGERARFAEVCRAAGARAKSSAAHAVAASHYGHALRLMDGAVAGDRARGRPDDEARRDRLVLTLEYGECLYMSGQLEAAGHAHARARELVEGRAELTELLMGLARLVMVRGEVERSLELALEAARSFELDLHRNGTQSWVGAMMGALLGQLQELSPEDICARPLLEDRSLLALLRLLQVATYPAYIIGDFCLFSALVITVIRLGLEHGLADVVGICFVQLAISLVAGSSDYEAARRQAQTGLAIIERLPDGLVRPEAQMIYRATLHVWLEPLAASLGPLYTAYRQLRAGGMLTTAGYAMAARVTHQVVIGAPLAQVADDAREFAAYMVELSDRPQEMQARTFVAVAVALGREQIEPGDLLPEGSATVEAALDGLSPIATLRVHTVRAFAQVLLGQHDAAAASLRGAKPLALAAVAQVAKMWFEWVHALHGCDGYEAMGAEQRREHEHEIAATLDGLARWEASCSVNAKPLARVLDGAWAQAQGESSRALELFTVAADAAVDSGFPNIEGLANERAAQLLLAQGKRRPAIGYLEDAWSAYGRWGAKVLQRRVGAVLHAHGRSAHRAPDRSSTVTRSSSWSPESGETLDVASVLEVSRALFEATTLEEVIGRLLATANENAGASRCVLLLDVEGELSIRADRRASGELYLNDHGVALDGAVDLLALSVIRACARSCSPVIVDDAARDPRCAHDPFVSAGRVRALLVVPVVKQSQRVGLLYLENELAPGVFTPNHVHLLTALAAQAAISIDNARLFDALREREAQWRAVVSDAPDFIVIVDRRRRIEFVNRMEYGLERDSIIGQPADSTAVPEARERVNEAIEYVFETGETTSYDSSVLTPNDGLRHFTTRLGPIMREGVVDRVTMISSDVTEQRRLQEHLRQSQKMQAIGTLAGGVAHDFNNLLTVIMGACQLCEFAVEDDVALELLGEINAAAVQAASLTRQLLAFSRKQVLQPQTFDLRGLVDELTKMLTRVLGENVELALDLCAEPCPVFADRGQLSQVLVNLAVNARDAMLEGGTLKVAIDLATGDRERRDVVFEVSDTGHGMAPEVCERIFEPFFTTKREGLGTGLGLSTVLGIVEQSGGTMAVDSAVGRGTTFTVTLPYAEGDSETTAEREAPAPRGTETILVVEDELAVQRVTARMLEMQGYTVRIAANGEQALALAREIPKLDLLMTDVVMPGANGREVAELVLGLRPTAKVLYTSGYTDDAVMRHGVLDGTTAFVHKPFTRESIARAIRAVLDAGEGEKEEPPGHEGTPGAGG